MGTFELVRGILGLVSNDVVADPNRFILGIGSFTVKVAPQCSGYEGIGLILAFLSIYLVSFRSTLRFPRALLLLPLGAALAWGANLYRIAGLISLGAWVSPEFAVGGFHSYIGALRFCGLALGIAAGASRSAFFSRIEKDETESLFASPTAARVVPLMAGLGAGLGGLWLAFWILGAMHDGLLAGTVAGMIYALVAHRRGELGDAVGAHATTNGLLVVYVLVTGHWSAMT